MPIYATALLLFICAFSLTAVVSPIVRQRSIKWGFFDSPGGLRLSREPLPKGGGIGIYASFWIIVSFILPFDQQYFALWISSTILFVIGLIDDRIELPWKVKLGGQVVAALLFALIGDAIAFVTHPMSGETVYIGWWGVPLTVVWLVALANMVNLIDGLDGLAAGVSTIASIPIVVVAMMLGRYEAALIATVIAGAAAGFLPHNFYPARLIMGDAGAMFLGFMLGAVSVEGALKGTTALALTVPILAFGFPILETLFSIVRRTAAGKPFYQRDMDHIHHRLLAMGFSHPQVVLILYLLSAVMAWAAVKSFQTGIVGIILIFLCVGAGSLIFAKLIGGIKGYEDRRVYRHRP